MTLSGGFSLQGCPKHKKFKKYFTKLSSLCIIVGKLQSDPLAQLEERYLDVVEVIGSSPIGITIFLF